MLQPISIHSTTRVETIDADMAVINADDFNPLHHEGGDYSIDSTVIRISHFNPLHHEGGDFWMWVPHGQVADFNPLHHEGGDLYDNRCHYIYPISIHSTTRVETLSRVRMTLFFVFQSTPPRGWRHGRRRLFHFPDIHFNPLHHEGGDIKRL